MSHGNNRSPRKEKLKTSIPNDLIIDIFSRLPGKSIARFHCLSKYMSSMLGRSYFNELFLTRSSSRPRLLFFVKALDKDAWSIYSSPQPQNPYGKPSSTHVVAADFHMKFHGSLRRPFIYTSGLVSFQLYKATLHRDAIHVICNPITGKHAPLPQNISVRDAKSILGFDPVDKIFKVFSEAFTGFFGRRVSHKILTLESEKMSWRDELIPNPFYHEFVCQPGICINGICYNLVEWSSHIPSSIVILWFDVRTEKFKFIDAGCFGFHSRYEIVIKLINYKGRLGGIKWNNTGNTLELCMCVLEDVEKQEWSKHVYDFGENTMVDPSTCNIVGATSTGEIVFSMESIKYDEPFYVYYFNPERNTLQSVEIKGIENGCEVSAFVDHVEDLNVNHAKELKSTWPNKQGLNINVKRPNSTPPMKNKQPKIRQKNKGKCRSWKLPTQIHA